MEAVKLHSEMWITHYRGQSSQVSLESTSLWIWVNKCLLVANDYILTTDSKTD